MRGKAGVAIVVVMMVLALLTVVTTAIYRLGSNSLYGSLVLNQDRLALHAAEAGFWRAVLAFREDASFTGFPETDLPEAAARYRVDIISAPGPGPKGPLPPGTTYIHAVGTSARVGEEGLRQRQVGALVTRDDSAYHYGLFAHERLDILGGDTDCWNSATGPFPSGTRVARAHVGSNGFPVALQPGSRIDAGTGTIHLPTGAPPTAITSDPGAYAYRLDQMTNFVMPTVTVANPTAGAPTVSSFASYLAPGTYGAVSVPTGQTLSLVQGATYQFDSLLINTGATLALGDGVTLPAVSNPPTDRTVVQITNNLNMNSGSVLVNSSGRADFLEFEIAGPTAGPATSVSGLGLNAYFVLKAPHCKVELLEGNYFGAIIARTVEVGLDSDCNVVYDLNLPNTTSSATLPAGTGAPNVFIASYQSF